MTSKRQLGKLLRDEILPHIDTAAPDYLKGEKLGEGLRNALAVLRKSRSKEVRRAGRQIDRCVTEICAAWMQQVQKMIEIRREVDAMTIPPTELPPLIDPSVMAVPDDVVPAL